jgi:hypothetical protein
MAQEAIAEARVWLGAVLGVEIREFQEELKDGQHLCCLVNKLRPGSIAKVNTYKAAFRCMQNIDLFLRFAEVYGVDRADICGAEDLYYGNNLVKAALTVLAVATAAQGQADVPPVRIDLNAMREIASGCQGEGGRQREVDIGLGMLDANARKMQNMISATHRQGDRMTSGSKEKSVPGSGLGMLEANASVNQKMVSETMRQGDRMTSGSKEKSVASAELGMLDANASVNQKMASEAMRSGTDAIVKMKDGAGIQSAELSVFEANALNTQKIVSGVGMSSPDTIVRFTESAD